MGPMSSAGSASNHPMLMTEDAAHDIRPLTPQPQSIPLTLHSHADTDGSRTISSSRRQLAPCTHMPPPIPPVRKRPVRKLQSESGETPGVTPRKLQGQKTCESPLAIKRM